MCGDTKNKTHHDKDTQMIEITIRNKYAAKEVSIAPRKCKIRSSEFIWGHLATSKWQISNSLAIRFDSREI